MLAYLILFFIVLPVLELAVLLEVGRIIGVLPTIGVVVITGALGASLMQSQGFKIIERIKKNISVGIMPGNDMIEGALVLGGGILLLTPGFISDASGFAALIPFTRKIIVAYIRKKMKGKMDSSRNIRIVEAEGYEVKDEDFISEDKNN